MIFMKKIEVYIPDNMSESKMVERILKEETQQQTKIVLAKLSEIYGQQCINLMCNNGEFVRVIMDFKPKEDDISFIEGLTKDKALFYLNKMESENRHKEILDKIWKG